jgi:hypothetical protein
MKIYCLAVENQHDCDYNKIISVSKDEKYIQAKYDVEINKYISIYKDVLDNMNGDVHQCLIPNVFFGATKIINKFCESLSFYREEFQILNYTEEQKLDLYERMAKSDVKNKGFFILTYELEDFLD